jgi:hypothetical protein
MSPVLQGLAVTLLIISFILAVVAIIGEVILLRRVDALTALPATRRAAQQALVEESAPETLQEWEEAWQGDSRPQARKAIPADPDDMPRPWKFNGPPNKRKCHCHGRFLVPGEEIIWWPRPDLAEGAVELYHFDSLEGRA